MPLIESFVFLDLETTGLPWQERNQTKIVELSIVSASRLGIENTTFGHRPPVSKLTFVVNPTRPIHPEATRITGLSNKSLIHAPLFRERIQTIKSFLEELPKPVCLVAHNGNIFDFKILLAELNDVNASLPSDLLCVDSLVGFRKILKGTKIDCEYLKLKLKHTSSSSTDEDLLTDDSDSDEWPHLAVDFEQIDEIVSQSFCDESLLEDDIDEQPRWSQRKMKKENGKENRSNAKQSNGSKKEQMEKECFTLTALYKRLLNKEEENTHRAEVDCLMLAECVVAMKDDFLTWANGACKLLTNIQPLVRY